MAFLSANSSHKFQLLCMKVLTVDDRGSGVSKVAGIRQIVRLKEILQKWQNVALGLRPSAPRSGDGPRCVSRPFNRRLTNAMYFDSDEESCTSPKLPPHVPKGYL
ncbi:hypothetical protein ES332_A08G291300v1 [Gossypium tomentosum]|nr:hypothetical protein ES332_A08G291300v1 [Gossypium tomentosum]